jgi:signal transduction histidine kinase
MTQAAPPAPVARPLARRVGAVAVTVLAVAASVLSSLTYYVMASTVPGTEDYFFSFRATVGLLAALGAAVALVWRHQRPVLVTAVAVAPPLLFIADTLAALIALAALAASRRDRVLWAGAGLVFAATALTTLRDAPRDPENSLTQVVFSTPDSIEPVDVPLVGVLVIAAVLTAIPLAVGLWRGARRDLAQRQRHEQELRADLTRQDERTRIAREMHDVLGHRLSILSLQAGALEVSDDAGPAAAEAARTIRTTAGECLNDLRQVIGVLRDGQPHQPTGSAERDATNPPPTLHDLPDLINASRRSGMDISVTVLVDGAASAPSNMGAAAYRIVQEALTNALRHVPGSPVELTVRGGPDVGLAVELTNPLPRDAQADSSGSGTGLVGITERVSSLGGTISAGPTDSGTFAVNVWLPWPQMS